MATATLFHLLTNTSVTPGTDPDPGTIISATAPDFGRLTTQLLDPATPAAGSTQVLAEVKYPTQGNVTKKVILGRWITRQLPAQTIGAGNWSFYGLLRAQNVVTNTPTCTIWGFTVAQWRAGTGVVARFLDSPTGGTNVANGTAPFDRAALTTVAGSGLTLTQNDQVVLEVWMQFNDANSFADDLSLCLNGLGQYQPGVYTVSSYTDTDAVLKAPAAITYT